jgi:3-phytase
MSLHDDTENLDSPAVWIGPLGEARVLTTAKSTHRLAVHDGADGSFLGFVGREGTGPGEFRRPNGIAIAGDVALVVERDNRRVQALALPGYSPLGSFGEGDLRRPYGIALLPSIDGSGWIAFITDNYEQADGSLPADSLLGERVRAYRLRLVGSGGPFPSDWRLPDPSSAVRLEAALVTTFGETSGDGRLTKVETIQSDPDRRELLVADEDRLTLERYDEKGRWLGTALGGGLVRNEPEGVALYRCGPREGYWLVTDQDLERNVFHVLDREDFRPLGLFRPEVTANTDGVGLTQAPLRGMPAGAFYAVHDDGSVGAFDWRAIAGVLGLRADCRPR